jgi:predicted dehydrogenase
MDSIKTAVIGVGHLGKSHARILNNIPESKLTGICDIDENSLKSVSEAVGVKGYKDFRDLAGKVDAVCVVVPTNLHYEVASFFLKKGVHVLCEKPVTKNLAEARKLIELSHENNAFLQIGHIERFNSAFLSVKNEIKRPRFIECQRLGPYTPRVKDVGVVLDLMIHDIDLVLSLNPVPLERIHATGISVFSEHEDMANAHLLFQDGSMANINASRLTCDSIRKFRVFKDRSYFSIDFGKLSYKKMSFDGEKIEDNEFFIEQKTDALTMEIRHFIDCIINHREPMVTGEHGKDALEIALIILDRIKKGNISLNSREQIRNR